MTIQMSFKISVMVTGGAALAMLQQAAGAAGAVIDWVTVVTLVATEVAVAVLM